MFLLCLPVHVCGPCVTHPSVHVQDDCSAGLQWAFDNKAALNASKIIVGGESGGGNLAIATTMKAVKDGKKEQVRSKHQT